MKKYIKKIDIFSAAKVIGILTGGVYFIIVLIVLSLGALIVDQTSIDKLNFLGFSSTLVASFIFAIIIGVVNFIVTALFAWMYNLTSSFFGGIKVELEEVVDNQNTLFDKIESSKTKDNNINKEQNESESLIGNFKPQEEIDKIIGSKENKDRETFKTED
jgi:hypothetical protein